jgi:hypothetical protein
MNVENPHTLGGRVVTNDTSAACLTEAERIKALGQSGNLRPDGLGRLLY